MARGPPVGQAVRSCPLLAGVFAAALFANCLTLGSGGSGGVFGPCLYLGAMLGGACGALAHALVPASPAGPGAYAVVGTGAFFAASAKAPATAVLLLLEMTHDPRILPPLLAATAPASGCRTACRRSASTPSSCTVGASASRGRKIGPPHEGRRRRCRLAQWVRSRYHRQVMHLQ